MQTWAVNLLQGRRAEEMGGGEGGGEEVITINQSLTPAALKAIEEARSGNLWKRNQEGLDRANERRRFSGDRPKECEAFGDQKFYMCT